MSSNNSQRNNPPVAILNCWAWMMENALPSGFDAGFDEMVIEVT
ncbi:hypothetical protein [Escherichia albertii]|nr:hypothetical protein [Escherichia albertii]MCV3256889.1 hypothetical protein [Escherichia albertii]MCV3265849.1 hypothetical protein [Escherichia albertii]MCZ8635248.1 hypothetical protein [Escherichia albertii]MCZ8671242.1 hypothetical protein [Escherichia albertii]MCZ8691873.1 hypothetical protein [Escherichia albertii]